MKISKFFILATLLGLPAVTLHGDTFRVTISDTLWHDAYSLYIDESRDYLQTLSETLDELKYWRQKILQEKFDRRIAKIEDILAHSNTEVLKQIEDYVKANGMDNLDDTLLMRMAQLNYERANFNFTADMRKFDRETQLYHSGKLARLPEAPIPSYKGVIRFSSELIHRYPSSLLRDKALYLLGYCLFEEGKGEEAVKIYEELVTKHPYSELVPEARWRQAEYYFDAGEYAKALSIYHALSETKNAFSLKGLYKEGAVLFAIGKFEEAANIFTKLFKVTSRKDSLDPEGGTLYDEAIDYLAHLKAKGISIRFEEDIEATISERLALAYKNIRDFEGERRAYLEFVREHPMSKAAPRFMDQVIEAFDSEDQAAQAQQVRNKLLQALGPSSPYWIQHQANVSLILDTQDLYEKHLLAAAEFYSQQARRTSKQVDYIAAMHFFRNFIEEYPLSNFVPQARFELAELQYDTGHYGAASGTYVEVVGDPASGNYQDDAAYGYLLSEVKRLQFSLNDSQLLRPMRKSNGDLADSVPLSLRERDVMRALEFYTENATQNARKQKVLYRMAEIYFSHNQFDQTRKLLESILSQKKASEITAVAGRLLAATYDLQNNWDKLVETGKRRLQLVTSLETRVDISTSSASLPLLGSAAKHEAHQSWHDAAAEYQQFSVEYPRSPDAPAALFKAGLDYREAGEITNSSLMFEKLSKAYPKNTLAPKAEFLKIGNLVSLMQFESAAAEYERFGASHPKDPLSQQCYLNAASLRRSMSDMTAAAADFYHYAIQINEDEVWFEASDYFAEVHKEKEAMSVLAKYMGAHGEPNLRVRALFQNASIYPNLVRKNCLAMQEIVRRRESALSAQARHAFVGCLYLQTLSLRDQIAKITFDGSNLEQTTSLMEAKLSELTKKYTALQDSHDKVWIAHALIDNSILLNEAYQKLESLKPDLAKGYREKSVALAMKVVEYVPLLQLSQAFGRQIQQQFEKIIGNETVIDSMVWPIFAPRAEEIHITWSSNENSLLQVAFEQAKWDEVERIASEGKRRGSEYLALARAQAEKGAWDQAFRTLEECSDQRGDDGCMASLIRTGYKGEKLDKFIDVVKKASEIEPTPYRKLALAVAYWNKNRLHDAFSLTREIISENSQWPDGYLFMSRLLISTQRPELAKIAMAESIRNTGGLEEALYLRLGYICLKLGLSQELQPLVEDLLNQNTPSPEARTFIAYAYNAVGKEVLARNTAAVTENLSQVEAAELLAVQFALAMIHRDNSHMSNLLPAFTKYAVHSPSGNYLLSLYFRQYQKEKDKALKFLQRAYELGDWRALPSERERQPATTRGQQ